MSNPQYEPAPAVAAPPRSAVTTAAAVTLIVGSVILAIVGALGLVTAASADDSGGMGDLAGALGAGIAVILLPPALLGIVLGWRLLRRGRAARIAAIVVYGLFGALFVLFAVSAAGDDVEELWPVVVTSIVALWSLLVAVLLLLPSARRDFVLARN